jgi:hypothetical protein
VLKSKIWQSLVVRSRFSSVALGRDEAGISRHSLRFLLLSVLTAGIVTQAFEVRPLMNFAQEEIQ